MMWYVLQVASGRELKIRDALQHKRLAAKVPRETCFIRRRGAWHPKEKTLIPGYVFLACDPGLTDEIYYIATRIPGVIRFLGTPKPQPITEVEAELIGILAPTDEPLAPSRMQWPDGPAIDGPLLELADKVRMTRLDRHRRRVKVIIPLLGEEKPVEFTITLEGAADGYPEQQADAGTEEKGGCGQGAAP